MDEIISTVNSETTCLENSLKDCVLRHKSLQNDPQVFESDKQNLSEQLTAEKERSEELHLQQVDSQQADLSLKKATIDDLNKYIEELKEENRLLQSKLSFLEQDSRDKLAACHHDLSKRNQELEFLRKELNLQLTMVDRKHVLEMQEERNRLITQQKEEKSRYERERREKEHSFHKQIQQLEARVSCLDTLNKELQDENLKHQCTLRELRSNGLSLKDETRRPNETIQSLRPTCDDLHSELREMQSHIHHLNEIISVKDQELISKVLSITRLKEEIDVEARQLEQKEEGSRYERERREKEHSFRKQIQQLEARDSCLDTLNKKLQDEILKHQCTLRELRSNGLSLKDETRRPSETIQSLRPTCDDLHSELREMQSHIHHPNEIISDKDQELRSKVQSIARLEEQIDVEARQLEQKEEGSRYERERREKEHSFRKQIQQLEARDSCLDTLNKKLQDEILKHQCTLRELRSNGLSLKDETRRFSETIQSLRPTCDDLHSELREMQSHIHHPNEIISDKDQELRSKVQSIARLEEQIDVEARQLVQISGLTQKMDEFSFTDGERFEEMEKSSSLEANCLEEFKEWENSLQDKEKQLSDITLFGKEHTNCNQTSQNLMEAKATLTQEDHHVSTF